MNFLYISSAYATDVKAILKHFDDLYRSDSSTAKIEMEIVNPNWQRTLVLESWSKGTEESLIRI